jgi:hypothetical protein
MTSRHLTQEQKDAPWAAIPEHERDARAKGIPVLRSGLGFPLPSKWSSPIHYRGPQ